MAAGNKPDVLPVDQFQLRLQGAIGARSLTPKSAGFSTDYAD